MCDFLNTRLGFCREEKLQLVCFKGRPGELSPKARFWLFAGWLLPDRFKYVPVLRHRLSVMGPDGARSGLISLSKSVTNLHLTATTGLSGVLQRVKKFDMSLTIMAHPHFQMDRPFSRLTCVLPWTASAASACAFVQPPDQRGRSWPQKHVILDFGYELRFCYRYGFLDGGR